MHLNIMRVFGTCVINKKKARCLIAKQFLWYIEMKYRLHSKCGAYLNGAEQKLKQQKCQWNRFGRANIEKKNWRWRLAHVNASHRHEIIVISKHVHWFFLRCEYQFELYANSKQWSRVYFITKNAHLLFDLITGIGKKSTQQRNYRHLKLLKQKYCL